ncbi:MAG TPA: type I restriction enzyme HsdR N-terminal domain-containing protein [Candidatus Avimuribaculum pullicola]|nr:type I restriction enzyme HsdR N-terminal domain-containing protein [Candidatus Avimuribaculum pullicola]
MTLNLPKKQFNIKKDANGKPIILDRLRHKFVALTPEEWVRQHFVAFLIDDKGFPAGLMANEVSLTQNGISRRCDTLVSDHNGHPLLIVEYKAPSIDITQSVFDQIVRYNMVLHASYLIVSNGICHYCCRINYDKGSYSFLAEIPSYADL